MQSKHEDFKYVVIFGVTSRKKINQIKQYYVIFTYWAAWEVSQYQSTVKYF